MHQQTYTTMQTSTRSAPRRRGVHLYPPGELVYARTIFAKLHQLGRMATY